jgi:hypothetical protein
MLRYDNEALFFIYLFLLSSIVILYSSYVIHFQPLRGLEN